MAQRSHARLLLTSVKIWKSFDLGNQHASLVHKRRPLRLRSEYELTFPCLNQERSAGCQLQSFPNPTGDEYSSKAIDLRLITHFHPFGILGRILPKGQKLAISNQPRP